VDAETNQGLVTDVCLKRKVRNYVEVQPKDRAGLHIFVREKAVLNVEIERAYSESNDVKANLAEWEAFKKNKKLPRPKRHYEDIARDWMCENFYDIRTFGAVMSTGDEKETEETSSKIKKTAGQVRGPIQFTMARSIDPVVSAEFSITRCAVTNEKDLEKERTMGRKFTVPYGLYRCYGYINATLAEQTGFTDDDLGLFKDALNNMFELDRSAARGLMAPVRCVAFRHENRLGNARADQLFARVKVQLRPELKAESRPPRSREDYVIEVNSADMPTGVAVEEWVK
jgi:CRISPR-associated protein Csd2